jgi:hypothetical protein
MYSAFKMAENGMIQIEPFGEEKSRAQRLTKESAGIGQDNVVLNGWSIPADRLEPIGPLFLAVGRAKELADNGDIEGAAQFAEATAWDVVSRMKDNTFLDSIARFTEAMTADDKRAARFFNQLGASFVPSIVRDVRQAAFGTGITEVTPAEGAFGPRGIIAEPIRGFAGRFGADDPKLGTFGEPRKRGALGVRTGGDPIAQELVSRGVYIDIPKLPQEFTRKNTPKRDRDVFIRAKGAIQKQLLNAVINSPRYQQLPEASRPAILKRAINRANNLANKRARILSKRGVKWTSQNLTEGII